MTNQQTHKREATQQNLAKIKVFKSPIEGSDFVAKQIESLIKRKQKQNESCVLGLATGLSPVLLYKKLIELHKQKGLSFENVITFNLDEYYPIPKENPFSYNYFMYDQLFDHIDIKRENIHIPDGTIALDEVNPYCDAYENKIKAAGGIDLQILGMGSNAHIGFNEPGSSRTSNTRLVQLEEETRQANSIHFDDPKKVPKAAITVGINTILQAKEIVLLAWGKRKIEAVKKSVGEAASIQVPASLLQNHQNCSFIIDEEAAQGLNKKTFQKKD